MENTFLNARPKTPNVSVAKKNLTGKGRMGRSFYVTSPPHPGSPDQTSAKEKAKSKPGHRNPCSAHSVDGGKRETDKTKRAD